MPFGKTFKFHLMAGIALSIGHFLDVRVQAAVFDMTHRAGCILQVGPGRKERVVGFSLRPAKRMAGQTLVRKIRFRKNGFHPHVFLGAMNRMA